MKMKEYAYTDNFYSCYVGGDKWNYKHVFRPNAISGRNSASKILSDNQIKLPIGCGCLFDQTKNTMYIRKDTI